MECIKWQKFLWYVYYICPKLSDIKALEKWNVSKSLLNNIKKSFIYYIYLSFIFIPFLFLNLI